MNRWWLLLPLWLASGHSQAEPACSARALLSADGSSTALTDCELERRLLQAGLAEALAGCAAEMRQAPLRVFGGLRFSFELHPGGGVTDFAVQRSAFDRTGLPVCLKHQVQRRLAGSGRGRPARIEGRLFVPESPGQVRLSLSGSLAEERPPPPPPLSGGFTDFPAGPTVACALDGLDLVVRLGETDAPSPADPVEPDPRLAECERMSENGSRGASKAVRCLQELLSDGDLGLRAAAAEALGQLGRWRARRRIERSILGALAESAPSESADPGCADRPEPAAPRLLSGAAVRAPAAAGCLVAPADEAQALALVRMLRVQRRLGRPFRPGVLEAFAAHPSSAVRLALLEQVLSGWRRELPPVVSRLAVDPEPEVRIRAYQLGCLLGDLTSLAAFRRDLQSPRVASRLAAALRAPACADRSAQTLQEAVEREEEPLAALVLLQVSARPDDALLTERAAAGLELLCPGARLLAARLLGRLESPPAEVLARALARERCPQVRLVLEALQAGGAPPIQPVQVWLQPRAAAPSSGLLDVRPGPR